MAALAINHFTLYTLCFLCFCLAEAQKDGFSVELIHRDSPKSPLYNPLETPYQRVTKALRRSINNLKRFDPTFVSPNEAQADIISNRGEYLLKISIGTPPVEIVGAADTGSDLIWTQCEPCKTCYNQTAPLFKPKSSSTYKILSCSSRQCAYVDNHGCYNFQSCLYLLNYGDGSHSLGNVSVDTVTLASTTGRPVALPNTIFGCGFDNGGDFSPETSGIIGLGGGAVSLISQLGPSIEGKFSYCLIPYNSKTSNVSKLNFGRAAAVSGTGAVSTPFSPKSPATFYFLTLKSISVEDKEIQFPGSSFGTTDGNIIIDSGTTLTLLPEQFTSQLLSAISKAIDAKPISDPSGFLDLCYNASTDFKVPDVTLKFSGADVKLDPINVFVAVSEDVVCCTFKGSKDFAIYGYLQQMNFLIGYDTKKQLLSIKPTDCTKH